MTLNSWSTDGFCFFPFNGSCLQYIDLEKKNAMNFCLKYQISSLHTIASNHFLKVLDKNLEDIYDLPYIFYILARKTVNLNENKY